MAQDQKTRANDPALAALQKNIRKEMNDYADTVASGGCPTIEEYRRMTGIIEGFALAERHLLDLDDTLTQD